MTTIQTIGAFRGAGGLGIHTLTYKPPQPKGTVVIVHGVFEHAGRYMHVADALSGAGWTVGLLDHRGHGRSQGRFGLIDRFDRVVEDTEDFVATLPAATGTPGHTFLLAHSMGGLVAAYVLSRHKVNVDGAVVTGATLIPGDDVPRAMLRVAEIVGEVAPMAPTQPLNSDTVSRDPAVVAAYDADPFVFRGRVPARTAAELVKAMDRVRPTLGEIDVPLLVLHGGEDQLANPEASRLLAAEASNEDVTLEILDGQYHEVLNEPEKDKTIARIIDWLDAHS